jgi:hypothetical protein
MNRKIAGFGLFTVVSAFVIGLILGIEWADGHPFESR